MTRNDTWKLRNALNGTTYTLLSEKEYVVGRRDADILVQHDASISRRHAVFRVLHPEANISHPHKPPSLMLQDVSKLGSNVEDVHFKGESKTVSSGNVITFGTQGTSKYRAVYEPFIVTTSCIAGQYKKGVKTLVLRLGGHTVGEWRKECQMLVMSNLSVTVKVICALVSLKPIVTPQYLQDLITAIENNSERPAHDNYLPPLAESQLDPSMVSFKPNKARQSIFQGKIFIFLSSKQFKKLNIVIELAGGTPMLMEEGTDNNEDDILVSPATCVMSCDQTDATQMSENAQQWINHVMQFLNRNKKRAISDPEIGYAILYCSTDKYCNPDSPIDEPSTGKVAPPLIPQSLSQAPVQMSEQPEILAPNTEMDTTVQSRTRHVSRGKITKIDETKIEHQIKKEPISQKNTQPSLTKIPKSAKKRQRDREDQLTAPDAKRLASDKHIKHEPITPQKTIVTDLTTSPAKSTRSRSKSPSPVPSTTRETKRKPELKPETKPETIDFDNFDFDSIPTRKSRRKATAQSDNTDGVTTQQTVNEPTVSKAIKEDPEPIIVDTEQTTNDLQEDDQDDFDAIPSRNRKSNRNKMDSKESSVKDVFVGSETENIADSKSKRLQTNTDSKDNVLIDSERIQVSGREDFDSLPARKSRTCGTGNSSESSGTINQTASNTRVKTQVKEEIEDLLDSNIPSVSENKGTVQEGFLSARRPIEGQYAKMSEFAAKIEDLPAKCVNVEEKSLMARKPGQLPERSKRASGNSTMWKGKRVKNFKRFRKVGHLGQEGLPTIIGGSDLVVHDAKPREELEEWFRDEMQAESQHNELENIAKELFDWEPRMKIRRH